MPDVRRVSPKEAKQLMDEGYTYVDVRTPEEFDQRHPRGSINVPLLVAGPRGRAPNADFVPLMKRLFPRDAKIVLGCATGVRSRHAAEMLAADGFLDVADQRAGMDGARSPFGQLQEAGWSAAGLPASSGADEGSLAAVLARAQGA